MIMRSGVVKKLLVGGTIVLVVAIAGSLLIYRSIEQLEHSRFERGETEIIVSNLSGASVSIFKAANRLDDATAVPSVSAERAWLPVGNYFLKVDGSRGELFYPVPITGYRGGPDEDGAFTITIRSMTDSFPPRLLPNLPEFVYIPSGHFLLGDRQNKQEPHYIWLTGYFISPFEVTNGEFREFLNDPNGYADNSNWTKAGANWRATNSSQATALLDPQEADFKRFGQLDQPVTQVNWFEANAFCRWLTKKIGGRWIYALPTEAEWEKAARGPDSFDYGLGMAISDAEVPLYNWKKNPSAESTVAGLQVTQSTYRPNRYGLYHMSGNVAEWTQSVFRAYNRQHPYVDDDERNHDETAGERVVRGGSWYSASIAILYLSYRENFQPEVKAPYLGFRVAARLPP